MGSEKMDDDEDVAPLLQTIQAVCSLYRVPVYSKQEERAVYDQTNGTMKRKEMN